MGQTITILNDQRLAFELLEKRSAIHSSRPKQIFAGELVGWENSLGLSPYNDRFRTYRKNFSRIIGNKQLAGRYNDLQEEEVGHFLLHVLDKPDELADHIRKYALCSCQQSQGGFAYMLQGSWSDHPEDCLRLYGGAA